MHKNSFSSIRFPFVTKGSLSTDFSSQRKAGRLATPHDDPPIEDEEVNNNRPSRSEIFVTMSLKRWLGIAQLQAIREVLKHNGGVTGFFVQWFR